MAGKPRTEPTPLQIECARHADAIVALIEQGATMREAIPRVSNSLTFDNFRKWARVRPDQQARIKAAMTARDASDRTVRRRNLGKPASWQQPSPARDDVIRHFDAIIAAIESGAEVQEAAKISGRDVSSLHRWAGRDPQMKRRLAAAVAAGKEAGTFSRANYDRALAELEQWPGVLNGSRFAGISFSGIYQRQLDNPDYRMKYDAAIARRNARFGIVITRYTPEQKQAKAEARAAWHAKLAKSRAARVPPPTPLSAYELRRSLLEHDLYRKASSLMRVRADSQDADDIRSDAILALLEGQEIDVRAITRNHHRRVSSLNMLSLDQEFAAGVGILDQLSTNDLHYEAAY